MALSDLESYVGAWLQFFYKTFALWQRTVKLYLSNFTSWLTIKHMDCVAPCLLLASPLLIDPHFLHTVVLIIEHNEGGAMGIVLNRPIPVAVAKICDEGGIEYNGDPEAATYFGGPVEPGRGTLLVRGEMPGSSDIVLDFTDFISFRRDLLESLAKNPESKYRLFLGYSGWSAGQLEGELEQQAWIRMSLDPELLFYYEPGQLWRETIKPFWDKRWRQGPEATQST